jgi:Transglutaminase-like superfamily
MVKKNGKNGQKKRGSIIGVLAALAVVILLLIGTMLVFPYLNPFPSLNPLNADVIALEKSDADNITLLNDYMSQRYTTVIYPQGKERIDAELEKIRQIPDPEAKMDEIFVWEMKDWVTPNDNLSAVICPNTACTYEYLVTDHDRIKASPYYDGILYPQKNPDGRLYADDPYWIAYNKIGECREYSALFAFMAQQSGIDARLVRTYSHQWVEVELPKGSYYYDPWCADANGYYDTNDGNTTFRNRWFNTIGTFEENCRPPDPYPMSYNTFPYFWATPKYMTAYEWHALSEGINVTLPG